MERTDSKASLIKREKDYKKRIERAKENFSKTFGSRGKKRVVWILILFFTFGGFCFHFSELAFYYESYILSTTPTGEGVPFEFPDVTMCHGGMFMKTKHYLYDRSYGIPFAPNPSIKYYQTMFVENLHSFWNLILFNSINVNETNIDQGFHLYRASELAISKYVGEREIVPGPEDVLMMCIYAGHDCTMHNFTVLYGENEGYCFRFRSEIPWRSDSDDRSGLKLILANKYVVESFYKQKFINGLKVYFHHRDSWPNFAQPSDYAEVSSTRKTSVTMVKKLRINTPLQRCRSTQYESRCHLGRGGLVCNKYILNLEICLRDYFQTKLFEQCGCVSYEWMLKEDMKHLPSCYALPNMVFENLGYFNQNGEIYVRHPFIVNGTVSLKSIVNIDAVRERYKCFLNFTNKENLRSLRQESSCLENCEITYYNNVPIPYQTMVSMSESFDYYGEFRNRIARVLKTVNKFKYNNISLQNYYKDMHIDALDEPLFKVTFWTINSEEVLSYYEDQFLYYSFTKLMSDLGGTLGCWLGCCVATLFEFLELAYLLWAYCRFKREVKDIELDNIESS